jgi:hypothetical protein
MSTYPACNFNNGSGRVIYFLEVDEGLRAHFQRERSFLNTRVYDDGAHAHCVGELHALDTYPAAAAGEDSPVAWLEAGLGEGSVDG